tara:strand:+ start:39391 stop:40188 length:798 start_codon:yes stop_codon:yes gene_type:complete
MVAGTSGLSALSAASQFPRRMPRIWLVMVVMSMAVLAGCASRGTQAPVADMSSGSASVPSSGLYVVRPGDTLYKISQMYNVDVSTLVQLNNISDPGQLRVGQTLRLRGDAPQVASGAGMGSDSGAAVEPAKASEPAKPSRAGDAGLISWGWPAQGKVIQGFSSNTKGVDIGGNVGDPVIAAASGKVMYAGNGVRGLGNLVLIGHSNSFITAYAHNEKLLVKTGQEVKKGDRIALMGQTDTTSPRLHFEIRRSGTPVNPLAYLPER